MTEFTRRGLFGLFGGSAGLAACATATGTALEDSVAPAPYAGQVAFEHGVASGDPLPDRIILWTRVTRKDGLTGPIPVSYAIFEDDAEGTIHSVGFTEAVEGRDDCVKVDAQGLEPGKAYKYQFAVVTGSGEILSPMARTRTTNASGNTPVKLAIVSCSNWQFGHFNVYDALGKMTDLDAIVHLGDYLYEYGIDGYGAAEGADMGRLHDPITEIVTLTDYRMRHAQYKSDPAAQAAHAAAPWLCTWDDHESTNNSYRSGAENHNPEDNEGDWTDRKQAAVQAYLEWMPVRDPEPGRARESIYRKFDFGDVATVFCLESRLTGRSDEISWFTEIGGLEPAAVPAAAMRTLAKVQDESRTMLGAQQEAWLDRSLAASVAADKSWQVLANQVIMARVRPPNFRQTLSAEVIGELDHPYVKVLVDFSQLGLPWNLDAWDGFPAARDRLYAAAASAGARLVTLTGDTHTAWGNTLIDAAGTRRGVEFGCTSVTSPGFGRYMPNVPDLGQQFVDANPEVDYYDPSCYGATIVTLTRDSVRADYYTVSTITENGTYDWALEKSLMSQREADGLTALKPA